jgi:HTH-type transcriptional dual regulator CecR, C-terminal domain
MYVSCNSVLGHSIHISDLRLSSPRSDAEPCLQVTTVQIKVPDRELQHTTDQLTADMPGATLVIQRFAELVDSVPTLRNYHRGMMDRLVDATAEAIAGSLGRAAGDPETQIAATSLVGLFRIQLRAIRQLADGTLSPHAVQQHVSSEVRRAATVVDHGLRTG